MSYTIDDILNIIGSKEYTEIIRKAYDMLGDEDKKLFVKALDYLYDIAFDSGYEDGYNTGYNEGYEEGYGKGVDDGYNTGYNACQEEYGEW